MDKSATLSLAYIEKFPRSAARALTTLDPLDAAGFLDAIPTRYGVLVLSEMVSWPSALILTGMLTEAASALLRELPFLDATAILRLTATERRKELLDALPVKLASQLRSSLSFPSDTIGASMTPEVISLGEAHTAGDAIRLVRSAPQGSSLVVFVVGEDHKLHGIVDVVDLLRCPEEARLGEIKRPAPAMLSARARLESVKDLPAWDEMIVLPVLSRRKHLIGALSRKAVFREEHSVRTDPAHDSIAASMVEEFLAAGVALGKVLLEPYESTSESEAMEV